MFKSAYRIEEAIIDASKAAYLATLIEKGQETVERFPVTPFSEDLQIAPVLTTKLNKLRIGLPEAYYYWAKTSQLLWFQANDADGFLDFLSKLEYALGINLIYDEQMAIQTW